MLRLSAVLLLFLITGIACFGQILKTNKISVRTDTSKATLGSLNLSFDYQNRSTSSSDQRIYRGFKLSNDLAFLGKSNALVFINQINYLSVSGADPLNTGYSHLRLIFKRTYKLSPELFTQIQYDETRSMPMRFLQGVGLKWAPIDTEKIDLHIGPGIMWEMERWAPKDLEVTEKQLWKSTTFIGLNTIITETLSIHAINYYQVGKDGDIWRNRLSGDIWLEFKISDHFRFSSRFSYQHEDKPIINIRKSILMFTNGLGINL